MGSETDLLTLVTLMVCVLVFEKGVLKGNRTASQTVVRKLELCSEQARVEQLLVPL